MDNCFLGNLDDIGWLFYGVSFIVICVVFTPIRAEVSHLENNLTLVMGVSLFALPYFAA